MTTVATAPELATGKKLCLYKSELVMARQGLSDIRNRPRKNQQRRFCKKHASHTMGRGLQAAIKCIKTIDSHNAQIIPRIASHSGAYTLSNTRIAVTMAKQHVIGDGRSERQI